MIVRPRNVSRRRIVRDTTFGYLWILRVKVMRGPDHAELADGATEILMIASRQDPTAARVKSIDPNTVAVTETAAGVDGEEPQLVEVGGVQGGENRVILFTGPIARNDVVHRLATRADQ